MMDVINARLENPTLFGVVVGGLYFLFRVLVLHSSPADALVNSLYIAAIAVIVRIFMNRRNGVRK
jgi:hypothetical protein